MATNTECWESEEIGLARHMVELVALVGMGRYLDATKFVVGFIKKGRESQRLCDTVKISPF